jgi:peptide/nickel transport system permease protein
LPHMIPVLSAQFLFGVLTGIFSEAGLAFLGLAPGHSISWGTMISEVQGAGGLTQGMWWWFLPPGLSITLLGMGAGLINFAVDQFSNPRLRGQNRRALQRALKTQIRLRKEAASAHV